MGNTDTSAVGSVQERLARIENHLEALRKQRDPGRLKNREEAADRLRISVRTLDTLRASGEIRAIRIGGRVLFHPDAIEAYVRRNAEGGSR